MYKPMDFDGLQSLWEQEQENTPRVTVSELRQMIHQKASGIMDRLLQKHKRVGYMNIIAVLVFIVVFAERIEADFQKVMGMVILILWFATIGATFWFNRWMKNCYNHTDSLKVGLENLLRGLKKAIRIEILVTVIFTPVGVFLGASMGVEVGNLSELYDAFMSHKLLYLLLIYAFVITVLMKPFMNWIMKRLYGKYIEGLEASLLELKNVEDENLAK